MNERTMRVVRSMEIRDDEALALADKILDGWGPAQLGAVRVMDVLLLAHYVEQRLRGGG